METPSLESPVENTGQSESLDDTSNKVDEENVDVDTSNESTVDDAGQESDTTDAEGDKEVEKKEDKKEIVENKTFKIKVNGKEQELTEKEVLMLAQKAKGADDIFREAAKTREEVVNFFSEMRKNPLSIPEKLSKMGIDFDDLAEQYLTEKYTEESMSEEQKLLLQRERELEKYKTEEARRKQESIESYNKSIENKIIQDLDTTITNTLKQSKYLPQGSPESVALLAKYVSDVVNSYYADKDNTTPLDIINGIEWNSLLQLAEQEYISGLVGFLNKADDSIIEKLLGDEGLKKINNLSIKKIKQSENKVDNTTQMSRAEKKKAYKTYSEYMKNKS